ncbi:MAG: DUF59 domain-containing protein [Deltaproteobacteria bacterium]|nr:DUF59 domain-containing protein [Deltaproteobacteria bacterium]
MATQETIVEAINKVEHPEVSVSLVDLGMIRDVKVDEESQVTFTLVIPFMGIPDMIRDYMIGSVSKAVTEAGGKVTGVDLAVMTDEERQAFFQQEQSNWKG